MIDKKKLQQIKCSICFKEKCTYFPMHSVLQSFSFSFFPFQLIQQLITNYLKKNAVNCHKDSSNRRELVVNVNSTLINPCKCSRAIHQQCLINQCLFLLAFKCEECDYVYSMDFKPKRVSVLSSVIMPSIAVIVLLVIGLVFIMQLVLPVKFLFWNYLIGVMMFASAIGICCLLFWRQNRSKVVYNATLTPCLSENGDKKGDSYYEEMRDYCLHTYQMNYEELIEQKFNIDNSLRVFKEKDINDYIKQQSIQHNKLSDALTAEEEEHDDMLHKRFGNHQIIKSSLVMSSSLSLMSESKNCKSNASLQDSFNNKLKPLSRTPLLMIKEAKEINEDFSPVHNMAYEKKITMNFCANHLNNQPTFHLCSDKPTDEIITLTNNP